VRPIGTHECFLNQTQSQREVADEVQEVAAYGLLVLRDECRKRILLTWKPRLDRAWFLVPVHSPDLVTST
jgi:hypothetical protein